MPASENTPGIRILPRSDLATDILDFLVDRQARGLSPRTVAFYRKKLALFSAYMLAYGARDVFAVSPALLRAFLIDLAQTHTPGGCHAVYRSVRAFLRWWVSETEPNDWKNPLTRVAPPKLPQELLDPTNLADLRKMLATCSGKGFYALRDRAMMLCLLDSGCRAGEFIALNIGDVNPKDGAVLIRHGKGNKARVAFFGAKARRALTAYLRRRGALPDSAPLWVTARGERLAYEGLRDAIRRRAKAAGLATAPTLHSFRRAFALNALRGGVDVYALQRLMGHADLSVLRRYLAQTQEDLQRAHEKAGVVDKLL